MSAPRSPVVLASNAALVTALVLIVAGLIGPGFLVYVGVFLLAVAAGLAVVNRSQRSTRGR